LGPPTTSVVARTGIEQIGEYFRGHPRGALVPVHPGMAPQQPLGKYGRLIDEIGVAVMRVPARSLEGSDEAVTMEHVMSRRRLCDLQGGCMAAH
jgi:hypothetical protein